MKFALVVFLSLLASTAFAAKCPQGASVIKTCKSTPAADDEAVAGDMLDSIAICSKKNSTLFVAEKNGHSEVAKASVETRMGGATYSVMDGDVEFKLSIVTGTARPVNKATFTVNLKAAGM
ncbi:MAG: hypothetical protein ACJ76H_05215, partial [Bacteriovoracaceae bacterium]